MPGSETRRLLASIHDVGPGFAGQIDQLVALLENRLGEARFAMLVVPNHWGEHPLLGNSQFAARLRQWADGGVEMFVHGWFHRDTARHQGAASLKARYMTASEGEFLGLDRAEAARRMTDGRKLIEDIIGREAAGFIAPAWLYGPGAEEALAESGFALAEDHMRVWKPLTGEIVARGPVITWASRNRWRTASSIGFAALARHSLHSLRTIRLAVHPGDVTKRELLASIDNTLAAFAARRPIGRYADLIR